MSALPFPPKSAWRSLQNAVVKRLGGFPGEVVMSSLASGGAGSPGAGCAWAGNSVASVPRSTRTSPDSSSTVTLAGRVRGSENSSDSPSHSLVFSIVRVHPAAGPGRGQRRAQTRSARIQSGAPRSTASPRFSASLRAIRFRSFACAFSFFCFASSCPRTILLRTPLTVDRASRWRKRGRGRERDSKRSDSRTWSRRAYCLRL